MSFCSRNKRAVLVTLEYADPIFSGNGVYSRSIVTGLVEQLRFDVLVISGTSAQGPCGSSPGPGGSGSCSKSLSPLHPQSQPRIDMVRHSQSQPRTTSRSQHSSAGAAKDIPPTCTSGGTLQTIAIPLRVWNRLDRGSDWELFRDRVASSEEDDEGGGGVLAAFTEFAPDYIIAVDWSGAAAARMLMEKMQLDQRKPLFVLFLFRLFSASTEFSEEDLTFYKEEEGNAVRVADKVVSCSSIDRKLLAATFFLGDDEAMDISRNREISNTLTATLTTPPSCVKQNKLAFLNPPLRPGFVEEGAAATTSSATTSSSVTNKKASSRSTLTKAPASSSSCSSLPAPSSSSCSSSSETPISSSKTPTASYLLCCCRLSPEKRVDFFVDVICRHEVREALQKQNIVPFLVGAQNSEWGKELIQGKLESTFKLVSTRNTISEEDDRDDGDGQEQDQRGGCIQIEHHHHKQDDHHHDAQKQQHYAIVRDFMSAAQLREVFRKSVLNFHPALYDSYAMTIVEAAACGLPSLIHTGGIGAADVLGEEGVFRGDMADEEKCAERLVKVLEGLRLAKDEDPVQCVSSQQPPLQQSHMQSQIMHVESRQVQETAQKRALAWESVAFAQELGSLLEEAGVGGHS
ncbi:unnamed protein product [Amoebophrya sp. A25]|nr:unnamed protein product [Amoebophrya sp. A25]|eukprot:GSA25T00026309001.1